MPVAVVTDTTQYMPPEVIARHGLHVVSLYVNWDGGTERESAVESYAGFYDRLCSATTMPTTSQPSVGDFLAVYEPLLESRHDIVSIHLSSGMSGTVGVAAAAREQLVEQGLEPGRIVIIDSQTACAGIGLMAIAAANAARRGVGVEKAAERAAALRRELKVWFVLDTMEFLRRGGRIGAASAWVGSTLRIKPILRLEAQIEPVERVRTWSRAFERLLGHLEQRHVEGHDLWVIQHARADEQVARLIDRGVEIFGREPEFISELGAVVGTHTGPGVLGVAAISSELSGPI